MKAKKLKLAMCVGAAMFAVSMSNTATAGSTPANLNVSASVAANCTITTSPVAFGAYDPVGANAAAVLEATGAVQVTCTKGAPATYITLGAGLHNSGGRRMVGGTSGDFLPYELYLPTAATAGAACASPHASGTLWTAANPTNTLNPAAAVWDGTQQSFNVCGSIPAAQAVSADASYTDVVVATINF
jgi:spore coat protein U-like protein